MRALLSLAGTPNLVVLLSLTDYPGDELEGSLDRIAHVSLDLPVPDRAALQGMFVDRIQPLMAEAREGGLVDPEYWTDVCVNGIDQFLRTPRDVVRLVNAVNATFPAVAGEVNPVDFVALETLRLFSLIAYDAVRRAAGVPAAVARATIRGRQPGRLPGLPPAVAGSPRRGQPDELQPAADAVGFPGCPTSSAPGSWSLSPRTPGARCCWSAPRRSSPSTSSSPFRPAPSPQCRPAEPPRVRRRHQPVLGNAAQLARDSHPDAGARLRAFLQRLEAHISEQVEPDQVAPTFQAVFQAADELLRREQRGEQSFGAQESIRRIVRQLLLRVEAEQRLDELELLIGSGSSIATVVDTVMMLGEQHGKYGGEWREGAETLITLSELARLENLALAAIREVVLAGSLVKSPRMPDVLTCWATWNRGECRTWASCGDHRRRRPAGLPRAVHERRRRSQRERARPAGGAPPRPPHPAPVPGAQRDRRPRPRAGQARHRERELHRQLLDRYVLDYELLQQATSADSEGEPDNSFAA